MTFSFGTPFYLGLIRRDDAVRYYLSDFFSSLKVQRVLVLDPKQKLIILTTPMRAIATWYARNKHPAASYMELSGAQNAVPLEFRDTYYNIFLSALRGSFLEDDSGIIFTGFNISPKSNQSLETYHASCGTWKNMMVKNFKDDRKIAYIIDDTSTNNEKISMSNSTRLLLKECELDSALGSPMSIEVDGQRRDGIQFRNGFGAILIEEGIPTSIEFPLYSPYHKIEDEISVERTWVLN